MGSPILALLRLTAYVVLTLGVAPVQYVLLALGRGKRLPMLYHRTCARILGFQIKVHGRPTRARPTLFVCNHLSYLDIVVLGSLVPGSFVAKADVAKWPVFGSLAKLQRTVFVDRRVASTAAQRDSLIGRLAAGENLILFPEGTSSDGNRTLPFKSALFQAASVDTGDDRPVTVQPISLACTKLDGWPIGRHLRSAYAWYGDMDLLSHIWHIAGLGRLTLDVVFHEPVTLAALGSRKQLSDHCWGVVAEGVATANAGRLPIQQMA